MTLGRSIGIAAFAAVAFVVVVNEHHNSTALHAQSPAASPPPTVQLPAGKVPSEVQGIQDQQAINDRLSKGVKVAPPPPPAASCKSDWTMCSDNAAIANDFGGYYKARAACKRAGDDFAKYGDPEWPWLIAFGSFLPGDKGPKTGVVTLIEPDARFKNGFNASVRTRVTCIYNLKTDKVVDIRATNR